MDLNHVVTTGTLRRDPLPKRTDTGTPQVSFTLEVVDTASSGASFTTFVPCEAYGDAAAVAGALHAGDSVLVSGKLKWTAWTDKQGQKRTSLCVLARLVKRLAGAPRDDSSGSGEKDAAL